MIRHVLGIGDLIAAFLIPLGAFIFSPMIVIIGAKWLIIKGGIFAFAGDMASFLDVFAGLYLILFAFGWSWSFFTVIVFIWVLQKAIFSLV